MAQISIIIRHPVVLRLRRPFIKPGIWDRLLFVLHYTWDPFFVDQLCAAAQQAYYSSSIIFVNQLISSGRKLFEVVNQMVCLPLLWNIVFEIICKRNERVSSGLDNKRGPFFENRSKWGAPILIWHVQFSQVKFTFHSLWKLPEVIIKKLVLSTLFRHAF